MPSSQETRLGGCQVGQFLYPVGGVQSRSAVSGDGRQGTERIDLDISDSGTSEPALGVLRVNSIVKGPSKVKQWVIAAAMSPILEAYTFDET